MASTVPCHRLNNGVVIPLIGFGTFAKGQTPGLTYQAVTAALDGGYTHLDCAWFYDNEDEIGEAIAAWLKRNPKKQRADLFITTKVWPHLCSSDDDVESSLNDSLARLKTDYVDCFLIHWPLATERTEKRRPAVGADGKYIVSKHRTQNPYLIYRAAEMLYAAGKTRAIGVSNWSIGRLKVLQQHARVPPAVNQIEIHPYLPNDELVAYCKAHNILPIAYSALGSQHTIGATNERLSTNPQLVTLAAEKGVTLAQLLIGWALKRGYGVLPKSTTPARIISNIATVVELSEEDVMAVKNATGGRVHRFCDLEYIFGYDVFAEDL